MQTISPGRLAVLAAIAAIVSHAGTAAAADPPRQPRVQVTATRTPVAADEALAHVTVITRADIEASGTQDVVALLRSQAGVDLARGGGLGQQASLFLRGSNANHVLVLIDGVRVASSNTGAYAWEHLPLAAVQRIEIVRGPRAALYGSDAIGGVIQIFTRRADGMDASLAAGSHDTVGADVGLGVRGAQGGFGVRLGAIDSTGFNIQRPDGFAFDPDDDGYASRMLALDASRRLGADQRLAFDGMASDDTVEFDQGVTDVAKHSLSLSLDGPLAPRWSHRLLLAASRETLLTPAFFARLDSRREHADWQHSVARHGGGELVFGLAWSREHGSSTSTFDGSRVFHRQRSGRAAYAAWRAAHGRHDVELALRRDHDSVFGGQTTGQAAWGWQASDATRLFASHGTGFRAPNFNELYSPGYGGLFAGNPELAPERSRSSELGLRHALASGSLSLHAFGTRIDGLVDFTGPQLSAINVRRARIRGAELALHARRGAWALQASATWQQPRDLDTGLALLRRPARKAGATLSWQSASGLRLGMEGFAAGPRPEFGGDLPGYGLLAASAAWPLGRDLWLDARIENLLDHDYTLVAGFATPGRTLLLRLRWRP